MTSKIPYRNLPLLLLKARESLLAHFRPILNHYGLTEQQWRVLRTLSEHQELEPRQLCELCHILSPSLTGVLARMEEMGLVERRRVPGDQRRQLVRPTSASEALISEIAPLIAIQYRLLERALGKDLVEQTYTVLDRLLAHEGIPVERIPLGEECQPASPAAPKRRARKSSRNTGRAATTRPEKAE